MPDNTTHNKRYIENEFRHFEKRLNEVIGRSEPALLYGAFGVRRCKSILGILDRAEASFGRLSKDPVLETLVNAEIRPLMNYSALNLNNDLTIGAALWILDTMRRTKKFWDMTKLLPDLTGEEPFYLPTDFSHPCFSNKLIEAVMHVLIHAYPDMELAGEDAARGEDPAPLCKTLFDMLPEEDVKRACDVFKEKQWDLLSRYMRCDAWMTHELSRRLEEAGTALSGSGTGMPFSVPQILPASPRSLLLGAKGEEERRRLAEETQIFMLMKASFPRDFSSFLQMDRKQIIRMTQSRVMADELTGFTLNDPYEICFAIYALILNGDDAAWLMASGSQLCNEALHMLPWFDDTGNEEEEDLDDFLDDAMTYDVNDWLEDDPPEEEIDFYHTRHNGRTLAQIVYDLSRGIVPMGKHPFEKDRLRLISEGMDPQTARKVIDMAELIFLREFQADTYRDFADVFQDLFEKNEEEEADTQHKPVTDSVQMPVLGSYWGQALGIEEKHTDTSVQEKAKADPSEELKKAKQEIKALRDALYRQRRVSSDDRAKYEHELKALRMEHRELADLRTLVFNRENPEQEEKTRRQIDYPYRTKKRTVIFGGHDSFLKAIKPMLPEVRFVDAGNLAFDPDIVRNAEVVWIQNNCISHSQYWAIVKNCRLAGVQMRYFAYASAEKCAEQVVEWDEK